MFLNSLADVGKEGVIKKMPIGLVTMTAGPKSRHIVAWLKRKFTDMQ